MASVNSKVESFNLHVKENRQGLKARGERTDDLMKNLFKAFMATSDKDFVSCVKTRKDECDECKEISEVQLMKLAINKHVNKKRDRECSSPSEEGKQAVALRSSLEQVKKETLNMSKALQSQRKNDLQKEPPIKITERRTEARKEREKEPMILGH